MTAHGSLTVGPKGSIRRKTRPYSAGRFFRSSNAVTSLRYPVTPPLPRQEVTPVDL